IESKGDIESPPSAVVLSPSRIGIGAM
ncbi:hypothetical protein A2U01_0070332, partial [Trifolium medium]|nr:hypothetical protein [Trifolium medium]